VSGRLIVLDENAVEPSLNPPFFPEALEGAPTTWSWRLAQDDGRKVVSGIWKSEPGVWRMDYTVWEYCHIIEGECTLTPEGGEPVCLGPGDSFVCEPGLKGTWKVGQTTRKYFVVVRS